METNGRAGCGMSGLPVKPVAAAQPGDVRLAALNAAVSAATLVRRNEPLAKRTTFRVGGPADFYVEPASEADLAAVLHWSAEFAVPFFVLGRGSNLLVRDGGVRGVVIRLSQPGFGGVVVEGERLRCGAGARLKDVAVTAKRSGLAGVEFFEGIPGSVGGALRMNAGAMGSETFERVESVRLMDASGTVRNLPVREMDFAYRSCAVLKSHLALGAVFKCDASSPEEVAQRMAGFSRKRWHSQPAAASAGCCFQNPPGIAAGKLVEELGLKGTQVGGAMVSWEHGNFIVNVNAATAQDILNLLTLIQTRARAVRGIELQPEIQIIGEN